MLIHGGGGGCKLSKFSYENSKLLCKDDSDLMGDYYGILGRDQDPNQYMKGSEP